MNKIQSVNLDQNETIFFARQLEDIRSRVYNFEYPALRAFDLIPISFDTPAGAEYITSTMFQSVGRARVINSYADDLPEAGVIGTQITNPVRSIGASYRYSHQEIRAARFAGRDLPMMQAEAARRAIEQKMNELAFVGDPVIGMTGFFNNPAVPTVVVPADGTGASTEWSTKTPDQILRDLNLVVNQIIVQSNGVERPNTLLLPLEQYTLIASTPRSSTSDTTILTYFMLNHPGLMVEGIPQLAGRGPGGTGVMVAYERNSNKLVMEIPLPFTQYDPQERNLEFIINCEARFGGVTVMYPYSMIIGEGI